MGVQYNLWGGSILNLGTEKHKKAYFEDIDKFRLPGEHHFEKTLYCFAGITFSGMADHQAILSFCLQGALP